jgi:hypothetical protein
VGIEGKARIVVNGVLLDAAQTMTFRVALGCFMIEMENPNVFGDNEHAQLMRDVYLENSRPIARALHDLASNSGSASLAFQECDTCRAKPKLCSGCLHNRAVIEALKSRSIYSAV